MKDVHYDIMHKNELYHWWYRVRRAMVHDILKAHAPAKPFSIADIGCGTGALLKELEAYGSATGVDFSSQAVNYCRARGIRDVREGTAEHTGLPNEAYDVALMLDVLEHLPDDTKGIAELRRVLKPGGIAVAFVPCFKILWGVTDEVSNHFRRYRLGQLEKIFRDGGFEVVRSTYFNTLLFVPIAIVRLAVRLLRIKMTTENETGNGIVNRLLYLLFYAESRLLKYVNFPFGISGMVIAKKI